MEKWQKKGAVPIVRGRKLIAFGEVVAELVVGHIDSISTLEQLVDLINNSDEWPMEANRSIRENGWIDDTDIDRGVCHTDAFKVVINDAGLAVVLPNEDGIVNQLKAARLASGFTQQQVASKMGIAQTALSRIESGTHSPSLDMVERYAEALGCRLKIEKKEEK